MCSFHVIPKDNLKYYFRYLADKSQCNVCSLIRVKDGQLEISSPIICCDVNHLISVLASKVSILPVISAT